MGKLAKLIIVVAIIAVAAYVLISMSGRSGGDTERAASDQGEQRPRLEEKYGFTGETVGD
jgi:hypothetical protein